MADKHREILRTNRTYLVSNITDLEDVVDLLYEQSLVTVNMKQEILNEKLPVDKTRKLLDYLPKKGPSAFGAFCEILMTTNQRHIVEILDPALAKTGVVSVAPDLQNKQIRTPVPQPQPRIVPKSSMQPVKNIAKVPPESILVQPVPCTTSTIKGPCSTKSSGEPILPGYQSFVDWPNKLNTQLGSEAFENVQSCTHDDLKQILSEVESSKAYKLSELKGRALIINNLNFDREDLAERSYADMDSYRIQKVLKSIGILTNVKANLPKDKLLEALRKMKEFNDMGVFMLVILSFGGASTVLSQDGKEIKIQEIVDEFSAKKCPQWINKPKLFFIQACGTILKAEGNEVTNSESDYIEQISRDMAQLQLGHLPKNSRSVMPVPEALNAMDTKPGSVSDLTDLVNRCDMLVAMANSPDNMLKDNTYSSLFILALSYVLCQYSKSDDIVSLLQRVNHLKKDSSNKQVQLCEFKHSLSKKLYFMPGYQPSKTDSKQNLESSLGNTKPTL